MTVVQFTDTHVGAPGVLHFGHDAARYLADAVAATNALAPAPECVLVTGDIVDYGTRAEYDVFTSVMRALRVPYFVMPGNHDDRDVMRAAVAPERYLGASGPRVRYAIERFGIRIVALDANRARPWPGAKLSADDLAWLERTLASDRSRPTIVAVHQPPFASGLPYLDAFAFRGARSLRATLARHPQVGRLIAGHIHHVVQATWEHALATSAPSTVPQRIPLLMAKGKLSGVLVERAGFAAHAWDEHARAFATTFFRRAGDGTYEASGASP